MNHTLLMPTLNWKFIRWSERFPKAWTKTRHVKESCRLVVLIGYSPSHNLIIRFFTDFLFHFYYIMDYFPDLRRKGSPLQLRLRCIISLGQEIIQHGSQEDALCSCAAAGSPSGEGREPSLYLCGWKNIITTYNLLVPKHNRLVDASEQPLPFIVLITIICFICYLIWWRLRRRSLPKALRAKPGLRSAKLSFQPSNSPGMTYRGISPLRCLLKCTKLFTS